MGSSQAGSTTAAAPRTSGAGRGVLFISFAKFYFMIIGLIIQVRLPALVSRTVFGAFGVVNAFVSPVNNVMVTGTIQTVSRFIAQDPAHARAVQRAGMRMHLLVGLGVAAAFAGLAPAIAWFTHDSDKTVPLMVGALIVAGYAFYAVLVGTANGQREFTKQAGLDVVFATLRAVAILGAAMFGLGVVGMVAGWVVAVGAILLVAVVWVGLPRANDAAVAIAPLRAYFAQVALYLVLFNLLMFADTWLLKRMLVEYFQPRMASVTAAFDQLVPGARALAGFSPSAAALADGQVAYYTAVQNLARLSYQAIIAVTFVVFPLVSRSTFANDRASTAGYVRVTLRYSLMFSMGLALVMAANPFEVLALVYPPDYARLGAPALRALALGNVAFSLFAICGTILNGAGLTRQAIAIAAATLGLAVGGNWIAIPLCTTTAGALAVAAIVTSVAMLIGAAMCGVVLHRHLGAFLPLMSLLRIGAAAAVALALGWVIPFTGKLATLLEGGIVGVGFFAVLFVLRELGRSDLAAIATIRKQRGSQGEV